MSLGDRPPAPDTAPRPAGNTASETRRDVIGGIKLGAAVGAVALVALLPFYGSRWWHGHNRAPVPVVQAAPTPPAPAPDTVTLAARESLVPAPIARELDFGSVKAPNDVTRVAAWAVREADNGALPFAIIDKRRAQVYVFSVGGKLEGTSPVLLGYAAGDYSVAGIGTRAIADIKPQERTTPAGRFESHPGRNALGDDVVWVDYDAAVSMHKVRLNNPAERRAERLATPTPLDNRISWGCVNVPPEFFENTVWPNLKRGGAVVYVLPETRTLATFFPAAAADSTAVAQAANSARPVTKLPVKS